MTLRLYFDEDAGHLDWIMALRATGADVLTVVDAEMRGKSDLEQLRFATVAGRIICTHNVRDFARIHSEWMQAGRHHSGILAVFQAEGLSAGEFTRRVLALSATVPDPRDRWLYLPRVAD